MKGKRFLALALALMLLFSLLPQGYADTMGTIEPVPAPTQAQPAGHVHNWSAWTVLTEPSCAAEGSKVSVCPDCGERDVRTIEKLPHSFGEWEIVQEPTSSSPGLRRHSCQVCGTAEEEPIYAEGVVLPGSSGAQVTEIQESLVDQGYLDPGKATGHYDEETEEAVKRFQRDHGLEPDGVCWPQTMDCLLHEFGVWVVTREPTYTERGERERRCIKCGYTEKEAIGVLLSPGDWHNDPEKVTDLQEALISLGYMGGSADGNYGKDTESGVKRFQRDHGLRADGVCWPGVWDLLFPPDADSAISRDMPERTHPDADRPKDDDDEAAAPGGWSDPGRNLDPDAAGKGGALFEVDLRYEFLSQPGSEGYYDSKGDVRYRLVLYNRSNYTVRNVKIVPLNSEEWERLNVTEQDYGPFDLDYLEHNKAIYMACDEIWPHGSFPTAALDLSYHTEYVNCGNGLLHLRAVAFCDFYDGEEYVGSAKPMAETSVKIGSEAPYELSAKLEYLILTSPANGLFYTEGETLKYILVITNTSEYDIKGIVGYRVDRFNSDFLGTQTGHGYKFSSNEVIKPGEFGAVEVVEETVSANGEGLLYLDHGTHTVSHYGVEYELSLGSDYASQPDGAITLSSFIQCDFYDSKGKLLGTDTATAEEVAGLDAERAGASLEIVETSAPQNGAYYVVGEKVEADFILTNTGNLKLSYADILRERDGGTPETVAVVKTLAPGESRAVYHYSAAIGASDAENGSRTISGQANCAFRFAKSVVGDIPAVVTPLTVPTGYAPEASLLVEEVSTPPNTLFYEAGDVIDYAVTIRNTGKVALDSAEIRGGAGTLAVIAQQGAVPAGTDAAPIPAKHTVTQEEAEAGAVTFTVEADCRYAHNMALPLSGSVTSKTGAPALQIDIELTSTAPSGFYKRNESIDTLITVSNAGNVVIPQVEVYLDTPEGTEFIATLQDFSGSQSFTKSFVVGGVDVANGLVLLTARAEGTIHGEPTLRASDSVRVQTGMLPVNVSIEVTEVSAPQFYLYYIPGEVVDYTVTVTNLGDEALPMAVVTSYLPSQVTPLDGIENFQPQASFSYPVSCTVTAGDAAAGQIAHRGEMVCTLPDNSSTAVEDTLTVGAGFPIEETENGGDHCVRIREEQPDGSVKTHVEICTRHQKVEHTSEAWRVALNAEYEALKALADAAGREIVEQEQAAFFAWLDGETRDSEELCALMREHCADACFIAHTASPAEVGARLLDAAQYIDGYDPAAPTTLPGTNPDALVPPEPFEP